MKTIAKEQLGQGLARLRQPILPLVRIVQFLYLTGPFERVAPILAELNEPVEMEAVAYPEPQALLAPYLPALARFEQLKHPELAGFCVLDENGTELDSHTAIELMVCQEILTQELEAINSLLCGPCGCALCCVGPEADMAQEFFEIPLQAAELASFPVPRIDSPESRGSDPYQEPPLLVGGMPFCQGPTALYHWHSHWSLILPRASACPNLDPASGGCNIYPNRPEVCRRPQIFPYALERTPEKDRPGLPAFMARRKLLAIWDCPYVRTLQEEIGLYAELSGLEPIFRENKG